VLAAYAAALAREQQDVLALATAFREPPAEPRLLEYLTSAPVRALLHATWGRDYLPFADRSSGWLAAQVEELVHLRLLERVGLAPALDRDLLLRFFPEGDWRRPPAWSRFARHRDLAVCLEMLGRFEEALPVHRESDAPLRGDALLALGRLEPILTRPQVPHPW